MVLRLKHINPIGSAIVDVVQSLHCVSSLKKKTRTTKGSWIIPVSSNKIYLPISYVPKIKQ